MVNMPDVASFVDESKESWVDIMEQEAISLSGITDTFYERMDFLDFNNYDAANNLDYVYRYDMLRKMMADQNHTRHCPVQAE